MKPVQINALNAIVLIIAGIYGYFGITTADGNHSLTAFIPSAFGLVLLIMGLFWAKAPKVVSHVAVVLTLVLLIMCLIRFVKVDEWNAKKYLFLVCVLSNAIALFIFVKSFIDVRRAKQNS